MFGKPKETIPSLELKPDSKEETEKKISENNDKMSKLSDERAVLISELKALENEVANKRMHVDNLTDDIRFLKNEQDKLERKLDRFNK